jgi:hypothetical protein
MLNLFVLKFFGDMSDLLRSKFIADLKADQNWKKAKMTRILNFKSRFIIEAGNYVAVRS